MSFQKTVYIAGIGLISPLGCGLQETESSLQKNSSFISPLDPSVFQTRQPPPLPVGQVRQIQETDTLPRTHNLAIQAAHQAMEGFSFAPDAVIIGTTTGGILSTEELLNAGVKDPAQYRYHGLQTVAEETAKSLQCQGTALTVSTACSSGTVAISMALKMLQSGEAEYILAGGVDSLCRLSYYGFHSLQLVDLRGSRPLDKERQGMSVAEGASLLLLTTVQTDRPLARILGCGLSCDAHHAAAPHPEGRGAAEAMQKAMENGKIRAADVDYINLHGTGTSDNDLAEAKAIRSLFPEPPPLSSVKGATGHSLAASGAIEAAIATICIREKFIPANTGCHTVDPECGVNPVLQPRQSPLTTVLSNSFGFGGNNACLLIAETSHPAPPEKATPLLPLTILGKACITGAGHTEESMERFSRLEGIAGVLDGKALARTLPTRAVRRLGRFSRMALAIADAALQDSGCSEPPDSVFMGTGWGALSETCNFLDKLRESNEKFPSPIDFVGSVHNSAAGQIAILHKATGSNITSSGGNYSFEEAVLAADTFLESRSPGAFLLAADEAHPELSRLFDPSVTAETTPADGGGGFYVSRKTVADTIALRLRFFSQAHPGSTARLAEAVAENGENNKQCTMILAGIPAAEAAVGEKQLDDFMQQSGLDVPVIHYRKFTGEFTSASAIAAVMAAHLLEEGVVSASSRILVLGFGRSLTAMEFFRQ